MTQKNKQLLMVDLCARLPYGVKCQFEDYIRLIDGEGEPFYDYTLSARHIDLLINHTDFYIKPYLRSMSSLTLEELGEYRRFSDYTRDAECKIHITNYKQIDWLNKHHFDYRGLIEKGLALEASGEMYNY